MTSSISESNQGTSANEENFEEDSKAPDELKDFDFLYEEHPSTQQDYLYELDDYPNDDFYTSNTKNFKNNDSAHDTEREIDAGEDGKDGGGDGNADEEMEKEIDLRPHFIDLRPTQALDDLNENDSEERKRDKKITRKKRHKILVENDGNSSDTSNQSKNSIRRPSTISYVREEVKPQ